jgi:hypothetical protein
MYLRKVITKQLFFVGILKITAEKSRIRSKIRTDPESVSPCY